MKKIKIDLSRALHDSAKSTISKLAFLDWITLSQAKGGGAPAPPDPFPDPETGDPGPSGKPH